MQQRAAMTSATADDAPGTQRVGAYAGLPALIRQLGADPAQVLAAAGLALNALDDPEGRIPYASLGILLSEAAGRSGCGHVGLLAGRLWRLSDLGIVGDIVRHSPDVGVALQALVVHQHLNSDGGLAFLRVHEGAADLGYATYVPHLRGASHIYDATLAFAHGFMRELCGDRFAPSEVFFPHSPPADTSPYRRWFSAPLRFDSEFGALRFASSWMHSPVPGAEPARLRHALRIADAADHGDMEQKTSRALRTLLLQGKAAGSEVAQTLAMHRRTLNRRLAAEETTFQQILDRVRFAVAQELLRDSDIDMHDIAATLGYAGLTPFMRAFRRWTGSTPGQWRRSSRAAGDRLPPRARSSHGSDSGHA